MRRVGFLLFDGHTLLDLSGPAEVLSRAPDYELLMYSARGGHVPSASGVPIANTLPAQSAPQLDTLIVVGADDLPDHPLDPALIEATRLLAEGARRVASVCTGAFVLAELGLLDGRRVTTHWRNARELARRYPKVHVEPDMLHVHDGRFVSSAGITSGIDLALSMVEEDHDVQVAREIAREMVVFMHRPGGQTQFAGEPDVPAVDNPIVRTVMSSVVNDPALPRSVESMAKHASVSPRHLTRLFREELGITPARWLEQQRLNIAQQLILDGHTITSSANKSGFGSDESLRRAFERVLGISPTEYKARFSTTFRRGQ